MEKKTIALHCISGTDNYLRNIDMGYIFQLHARIIDTEIELRKSQAQVAALLKRKRLTKIKKLGKMPSIKGS